MKKDLRKLIERSIKMGNDSQRHANRMKSLLFNIDKEIRSIPQYKSLTTKRSDGSRKQPDPGEVPFVTVANGITAARRALRFIKGEPSKKSLEKKADKLTKLIENAKEFKGMTFMEDGEFVDARGRPAKDNFTTATGYSRKEFIDYRDKGMFKGGYVKK